MDEKQSALPTAFAAKIYEKARAGLLILGEKRAHEIGLQAVVTAQCNILQVDVKKIEKIKELTAEAILAAWNGIVSDTVSTAV
jgi:hypothetical protein